MSKEGELHKEDGASSKALHPFFAAQKIPKTAGDVLMDPRGPDVIPVSGDDPVIKIINKKKPQD